MKKATLLAPRNSAREILSDTDAQRMLDSGSWVIATVPKRPTAGAINQRKFKRRRAEAGYRRLDIMLTKQVFNALQARRQSGESLAALIKRLLELPDDDGKESRDDTHN